MILPDPIAVTGVASLAAVVQPGIARGPETGAADVFAAVFRDAAPGVPDVLPAGRSFPVGASASMPEIGAAASSPDSAGAAVSHVTATGLAQFPTDNPDLWPEEPGTDRAKSPDDGGTFQPAHIPIDLEQTLRPDPVSLIAAAQSISFLPTDGATPAAGMPVALPATGARSHASAPTGDTSEAARSRLSSGPAPINAPADLSIVKPSLHIEDGPQIDPLPDMRRPVPSAPKDASVANPDQVGNWSKQSEPVQPAPVADAGPSDGDGWHAPAQPRTGA